MSRSQLVALAKQIAPDLQYHDLADVVSAALVKLPTCGPKQAIRYALADWLRDQVEVPAPIEDTELRRELQTARRSLRSADDAELAKWDSMLSRFPERERDVASRLAAGYSMRDIAAELRIGLASADRAVKALRGRLVDPILWHPILDALYGLPDSKIGRAEWDTDLSEYRVKRTTERRAVLAVGKDDKPVIFRPRFTTGFVPCHHRRKPYRPMTWYPGMTTWNWHDRPEPAPSGLLAVAFGLGHEPNNYLRFSDGAQGKRSNDGTVELTRRELSGLERGERWLIDSDRHGVMVRTPLPRIGFMGWYPGQHSPVVNRQWVRHTPKPRPSMAWYPGMRS